MRRSLFRYFDDRRWADAFLAGELYFRQLAYFRAYEDGLVRGDRNEGVSVFAPAGGLVVTNQTRGTSFTMPGHRLESAVHKDEIWVYCLSRARTAALAAEFGAVACVEIQDVPEFCRRVRAALPAGAEFAGRRVDYYRATDAGNPRWALPDQIATAKLDTYARQAEFRLVFSTTGALGVGLLPGPRRQSDHRRCVAVAAGVVRDLARRMARLILVSKINADIARAA